MDWYDESVRRLVSALDEYQIGLYGEASCNLEPVEELKNSGAILLGAFDTKVLMGIGAVRVGRTYAEIKRVYFRPEYRGTGAATRLMSELEAQVWTRGLTHIYLETGRLQYAALRFYERLGYVRVERFGAYRPNPVSVYMRKTRL
jgi:putative acetyltransferase